MKEMWNQRYSEDDFIYGFSPNVFLAENYHHLKKGGKVLCIAEGEGRNALFLTRQGFEVTAVDFSEVAIAKLKKRVQEEKLQVEVILADLEDFDMGISKWDAVVSIFAHTPPSLRVPLYQKIQNALKEGGILLLEGYTPEQLKYGTGGPKDIEMLINLDTLHRELPGLKPLLEQEITREIHEGKYHNGMSAVVQFIGCK